MPVKLSWKLLLPLAFGGLVTTAVAGFVVVYILTAWWSKPLFGFGAGGPDQPIAFPHDVHVEEAGIQCEFCHRSVTSGAAATVPAVEQCLFCHKTVNGMPEEGSANQEIVKLLAHGGLGPDGTADPDLMPESIEWERVHRVPDHVQFFHEPHIRFFTQTEEGLAETMRRASDYNLPMSSPPEPGELVEASCAVCHGKVREMDKVKQERRLKMGDCVDCHRDNDAPTDCVICHY